jgi:hypothetical protein
MEVKKTTWNDIKKSLKDFSRNGFLDLLKDLYESSKENQAFMSARFCSTKQDLEQTLEPYKKRIVKALKPHFGQDEFAPPRFKVADAKKAIAEYKRATVNIVGTLDLMLFFVETGLDFIDKHGFLELAYSLESSLYSVLSNFKEKLEREDQLVNECFRERIYNLHVMAARCDLTLKFTKLLNELNSLKEATGASSK